MKKVITALTLIEESFIETLRINGFDIAPDAVCRVERHYIELGIAATGEYKEKGFKMAFASDISLYVPNLERGFGRRIVEINFGSSGCFTPDNRECYWRTIHAASILKKWDKGVPERQRLQRLLPIEGLF